MRYIKYVFVLFSLTQSFVSKSVTHKNFGLNYHQVYYNNAVSLNYNLRWNLIGKNQWNGALAFNPHFGALFLNNPTPFIFLPLNLEYHKGMGANFDVLKYRGYSYRLGASLFNTKGLENNNDLSKIANLIQYGPLIGGDYKFQSTQLKTFSLQWNIVYSIPMGINHSFMQLGVNYHFGYY
jgi:hypothetical protein